MHPSKLNELTRHSRGCLPHWQVDDSFYFVTYRLADSLPREVMQRLREEHKRMRRRIAGDRRPTLAEHAQIGEAFARKLDQHLDIGYGACLLRREEVAEIVAENLRFFDGKKYALDAWCVMPNHVHVIVFLQDASTLPRVVHSWKSYTSKIALRRLGLPAPFWQADYFDRIIRDADDLERTREYILANPAVAGLANWKWVGGA